MTLRMCASQRSANVSCRIPPSIHSMRIKTLAGLLFFLAACGDRTPFAREAAVGTVANQSLATPAAAPALASYQAPGAPASSFWAAQKLIRTAELQIQVRDVPAALKAADSIAQAAHALVADSRTTQDEDGKRTAEVLLRVPSQEFPALLRALRGVGSIKVESIGTQDITREYADLETRLAVKEQMVTRLRALLDNRTAKLADVLEVERELGRAVAELEQMKGERRYYDQQIALSTVRLTLFERVPTQLAQISKPIDTALENAMQVLGASIGTIIYLLVALAPWIIVALGVVWLVPSWRRRFLSRKPIEVPPAA